MEAESNRSSHFFKIMLPYSMRDMKLSLPVKFVREFGEELSPVAVLTVPTGCIWRVGLEKADQKIWFSDGWQDFAEYHSIQQGYFLVFKYEGNSKFHVLVFDLTATEIKYPSNGRHQTKGKDSILEDEEEGSMKLHSEGESKQGNSDENEMSDGHELSTGDEEVFVERKSSDPSSSRRLKMLRGRERAIKATTMSKTRNPFFLTTIRRYNLYNSFVTLRTRFARKHLTGRDSLMLEASDGKRWPAACRYKVDSPAPSRIGKGWSKFAKDNRLNEGDVCVFELISEKDVVLKVSIFRSS